MKMNIAETPRGWCGDCNAIVETRTAGYAKTAMHLHCADCGTDINAVRSSSVEPPSPSAWDAPCPSCGRGCTTCFEAGKTHGAEPHSGKWDLMPEREWSDDRGGEWTIASFLEKMDDEGGLVDMINWGGPEKFPPAWRSLAEHTLELMEHIDRA